ncbi:UNVERIFIED_CONTAM: hypothetical protein K2H54_028098 [Gekko kuhli]
MSGRVPIVSPEDLERITLTRTGFGFILKAFHTPRNADVVLKLLACKNATDRDLKALLEDVAGIQHVHCERLMPPIGIYQFQGLLGVVTEWMHNGSLHSLIHEHELYPDLPLPLCVRILTDVAEGLSHLHSLEPPILHHSLKPSNVLLDLEYRAKFLDPRCKEHNWKTEWGEAPRSEPKRVCLAQEELSLIPPEYRELAKVFEEGDADKLPPHRKTDGAH